MYDILFTREGIIMFAKVAGPGLLMTQLPLAVFNGCVARRLKKNIALWVLPTLIPIVGYWMIYVVAYQLFFYFVERLEAQRKRNAG
jgi:hypothetical protein